MIAWINVLVKRKLQKKIKKEGCVHAFFGFPGGESCPRRDASRGVFQMGKHPVPDEGLHKAKYRTMLFQLPACPHPPLGVMFPVRETHWKRFAFPSPSSPKGKANPRTLRQRRSLWTSRSTSTPNTRKRSGVRLRSRRSTRAHAQALYPGLYRRARGQRDRL